MAIVAIRRPVLLQQNGNMHIQRPPIGDGANSFKAGDLVQVISGALQLVPTTSGTASTKLVWGQTPDDSKVSTQKAPDAFFGENHYCFDVTDATIEVNITNSSGGVGDSTTNNGAAGPQLSAITIGAAYAIKADCTNYVGVQMLNVSDTTNTVLTVVGISPNQSLSDYNGRVLCKIPKAQIQG
jgi:hypothetical protein